MTFLVFDAKQSPTDNFNTWSAQVKAHPDALAYVGPGSQAAVSLSRIQRKPGAKKLLVGACDLDQVAMEGVRDGYVEALISPEHWLKGYLAVKLMADATQSGKALPEGMWNSGALTVNKDNIDEIIARQKDPASRAAVLQGRGRQAARRAGPVPLADADRLMLEARDLSKSYGGVVALSGADFTVRAGAVHALLGENGAGKSTLVKILAGALAPDSGTVELDGLAVRFSSTAEAVRAGVAVVSQELNLFPDLDVLANLYPMRELKRGPFVDRGAMAARARPVLRELGLDVSLRAPGRRAVAGRAPAAGDRQGAADRAARADPRRADVRAGRDLDRDAAGHAARAARPPGRRRVRLAHPRGRDGAVRRGHGAARRARWR